MKKLSALLLIWALIAAPVAAISFPSTGEIPAARRAVGPEPVLAVRHGMDAAILSLSGDCANVVQQSLAGTRAFSDVVYRFIPAVVYTGLTEHTACWILININGGAQRLIYIHLDDGSGMRFPFDSFKVEGL